MPPSETRSLWDLTAAGGLPAGRVLSDGLGQATLASLATGTNLDGNTEALRGRTVLLSCDRQLPAALALLALDGVAGRILLCPPDLAPGHIPAVIAEAGVEAIVSDGTGPAANPPSGILAPGILAPGILAPGILVIRCHDTVRSATPLPHGRETEWLLFTSGTTGRPKLVSHTLASLTGPLAEGPAAGTDAVWSTFYDIRRYGGLQILLRALLGGGSLILSRAGEPVAAFLTRMGEAGVTHVLGTPSHWRRALMSPALERLSPRYVRLSGEVADQTILTQLARTFPGAGLTHAFASTEAGVGFEVNDGLEGFPESVIGAARGGIEIRVVDGSLRIRSPRTAARYLGDRGALAGAEGFVDTGDMVTSRDGRYYFAGRREGIINVGGQKVHPEEVEAVINRHPGVLMSRVRGKASPITGALVVADVVLRAAAGGEADGREGRAREAGEREAGGFATLKQEILEACRAALPPHKAPVLLREVASLEVSAAGKMVRDHA